jgi:hypothetical protein
MNLEIQNFPRAKFRPLQKFWKTERLFKLLEYYPRLTVYAL